MNRRVELYRGWHAHVCPCGERWLCSKRDCQHDDDCTACELATRDRYYEARGLTVHQIDLPILER